MYSHLSLPSHTSMYNGNPGSYVLAGGMGSVTGNIPLARSLSNAPGNMLPNLPMQATPPLGRGILNTDLNSPVTNTLQTIVNSLSPNRGPMRFPLSPQSPFTAPLPTSPSQEPQPQPSLLSGIGGDEISLLTSLHAVLNGALQVPDPSSYGRWQQTQRQGFSKEAIPKLGSKAAEAYVNRRVLVDSRCGYHTAASEKIHVPKLMEPCKYYRTHLGCSRDQCPYEHSETVRERIYKKRRSGIEEQLREESEPVKIRKVEGGSVAKELFTSEIDDKEREAQSVPYPMGDDDQTFVVSFSPQQKIVVEDEPVKTPPTPVIDQPVSNASTTPTKLEELPPARLPSASSPRKDWVVERDQLDLQLEEFKKRKAASAISSPPVAQEILRVIKRQRGDPPAK